MKGNKNPVPQGIGQPRKPFRIPDRLEPVPGLREAVEPLHSETRFRSAMDEVFRVLQYDRHNPEALYLGLLLASESRTNQLHAEEPLTTLYFKHPYLDPVVTECSRCKSQWFSRNYLVSRMYQSMTVTNPLAVQCQGCMYTLCRNCASEVYGIPANQLYSLDVQCPKCGKNPLGVPVLPTGRDPVWPEHTVGCPLERVLVLREGPIAPAAEYLEALFQATNADALREGVQISVYPAGSQQDLRGLAEAIIARLEAEGELSPGALHRAVFTSGVDQDGLRLAMARIIAPEQSPQRY